MAVVVLEMLIELPLLRQERKIKGMQMFRRPVDSLQQGDRAGICVTSLDAELIERGLVCTPGSGALDRQSCRYFSLSPLATLPPFPVSHLHGAIAFVRKIRFFKGVCASQSKFHVTVGHSTVVATAVFFGARELAARMAKNNQAPVAVTAGVIGAASTASTEPVVLGSLKLPAQAGDSPIPSVRPD